MDLFRDVDRGLAFNMPRPARRGANTLLVIVMVFLPPYLAFLGFMSLTLGHAVLTVARPHDAGYVADGGLLMQVGAVGGAIVGAGFCAVWLVILVCSGGGLTVGIGAAVVNMWPGVVVCGATAGPVGVAVLKTYAAERQLAILSPSHAAAAGALGALLVSFGSCSLAYAYGE